MALLASSWLLVESFIIPHGFRKWFYLSFYIHPTFLVFCQILLWLKKLQNFLLLLVLFAFKIASFLSLFIFRFLNKKTKSVPSFSSTKSTKIEVLYNDAMEQEITQKDCKIFVSYSKYLSCEYDQVKETKDSCVEDSWLNEYLYSDHYTNTQLIKYYDLEMFMDDPDIILKNPSTQPFDATLLSKFEILGSSFDQEFAGFLEDSDHETRFSQSCDQEEMLLDKDSSSSAADNFLAVGENLLPVLCRYEAEDVDFFRQKYIERMRFFEVLYAERLYGLNTLLNEHLTSPGLFMSPDSWSKMARERVMRSLECEFELIYVAQLCLSWEALHHQYQKVEALNYENISFHHSVTGKFQEFQILFERFVEDQKIGGQKYSNYTHQRLAFQGQLRVPDVTSFMVEENNGMGGEATKAIQVLRSIEKCIKAFSLYLKTDNKKSVWKYKGILRTHNPPVEDPTDLELLYNVSKALHKKWIMLRDLQGKKNCWLRRRVREIAENEKRNLLFAMIDINLVQRLLKMPVIPSSQLKWCQQKLNNLEFKQGQVFRSTTSHLFPSS